MTAPRIIDSHIHLWPHTAASPAGHAWMQPGAPLTRQFSLPDYNAANKTDVALEGFIYVETDRRLDEYDPSDSNFNWAKQTFEELRWLRRIVEGIPAAGEAFGKEHSALLKGAVIWAPVDHGPEVFMKYLEKATAIAGEKTWHKVKGVRFLFQDMQNRQAFQDLVLSDSLATIFRILPNLDAPMSFDVGVDSRSTGVWQLEVVTEAIKKLRTCAKGGEKTVFILSKNQAVDIKSFLTDQDRPHVQTRLPCQSIQWRSLEEQLRKVESLHCRVGER